MALVWINKTLADWRAHGPVAENICVMCNAILYFSPFFNQIFVLFDLRAEMQIGKKRYVAFHKDIEYFILELFASYEATAFWAFVYNFRLLSYAIS